MLRFLLILISFTIYINATIVNGSFTKEHLVLLRSQAKELFNHGWDSYMNHAYPADELKPLSCEKYEKVGDIYDINRNDVLGNYSVTFLDTLTTFAVMGDVNEFSKHVETLRDLSFDLDSNVQVFETTIRALGSLLSTHLYASDKFKLPNYDGFLLDLAKDLGDRLIVSYQNDNELPLARVNLRYGTEKLPNTLIRETCTAGATSPMLELTLLSVLTGDPIYEYYSRRTFSRLWNSKSKLNLLPMSLDPINAKWLDVVTGIGASIDSFYEYALKGSILFNDNELLNIWKESIKALTIHSKIEWFFANVQIETGAIINPWIDALSAFFPGVLVLAGELETAITVHQPFMKLWNRYGGIPERWDYLSSKQNGFSSGDIEPVTLEWYPLRPEFIESTYYLYQATKDPLYLRIGERILNDFSTVFKVDCGFSGFRDIIKGERQDRMESFVLSETLMYLYLLFDTDNDLNKGLNVIFSTEGHPLWVPKGILKDYKHKKLISAFELSNVTELASDETLVSSLLNSISAWPKDELKLALHFINDLFSANTSADLPNFMEELDDDIKLSLQELSDQNDDVCPVYTRPTDSFYSPLLSDPTIFLLDSKFHNQWKHINHTTTIELEDNFYSTYGDNKAQSYREPSVSIWDLTIGHHSPNGTVDIKPYNSNDLWVDSLEGIRLKLEVLELNKVDFTNQFIDKTFLSKFKDDSIESSTATTCGLNDDIQSVLKVRTINGKPVGVNSTIFVSKTGNNPKLLGSNAVGISKKGHLVLSNRLVSNMKLSDI